LMAPAAKRVHLAFVKNSQQVNLLLIK